MKNKYIYKWTLLTALSLLCMSLCTGCGQKSMSHLLQEIEDAESISVEIDASLQREESKNATDTDRAPDTEDSSEAASTESLENQDTDHSTEEDSDTDQTKSETGGELMTENNTPYELHGALHVADGKLRDCNNEIFQLQGMSTHGIAWYPQYVNKETFAWLRDEYGTNAIRLAMYTAENGGYCTGGDKEYLKTLVKNGVEYATELGMYVIIDWHILSDNNPQIYKEEAKAFFSEMAMLYKDYGNVLFEICNEPNNTDWNSVKTYAEEVIPVIRDSKPDAVILMGTPTWSQDLECPLNDPLDFENILYSLHFYAGTHKEDLRNRAQACIDKGLPVMVTEFGVCDASGNGGNDFDSTAKWLTFIEDNQLSFFCWALGQKDESCCIILPGNDKLSGWTDAELNESGKWILDYFKKRNK